MITTRIVQDAVLCEQLWKQFSHDRDMFDLWEYRFSYFDPTHHRLHFIVASENGVDVGLLATWYHKTWDWFEFFGGELMEHNRLHTTRPEVACALTNALTGRYWLTYIDPSEASLVPMIQEDTAYSLDLGHFGSVENYLESFSGKHRKNLRHDLTAIEALNPIVHHNRMSDVDELIRITHERFGKGSFLSDPVFERGFRRMIDLALQRKELHLISISIDSQIVACQAAICHAGIYTVIIGAALSTPANVGKLLILSQLRQAQESDARTVDFLSTEPGWKELWNLTPQPMYELCNFTD